MVVNRWAKVLLAAGAALTAVAVAELFVRVRGLVPAFKAMVLDNQASVYKRSTNPILSFELKANYRNPDADLNESYPSTNAHGQRDIERTIENPKGAVRILLLGDSVVEGHGIRELDQTISRQLEMLDPDGKSEVLNFGVSGYCTLAEVELLRTKGISFQPDIVILLFVENDFENFNREAFELGRAVDRPELIEWLFARSDLFRLLCVQYNLFQFGSDTDPVDWNQQAIGDDNVVKGLKRLYQLSESHDFRVLIAIWPEFTDAGILDRGFMPDEHDELIIERLGSMHGFDTVRLSDFFERDRTFTGGPVNPRLHYTIGDRQHPSPEGCRLAAEALWTTLLERKAASVPESDRAASFTVDHAAIEAARFRGMAEPDYFRVYSNKGSKLAEAGCYNEASHFFELALETAPQSARAHYNLAKLRQVQGKIDEAVRYYQLALEVNPDLAEAHNNLGSLLQQQGELEATINHFLQVVRIRPDDAKVHYRLGVLLGQTGQTVDAIEHFGKAVVLEADWTMPMNGLAWVLATHPDRKLRDSGRAIRLAQRASELTENRDASILDTLAAAYAAANQFDQAVATAEAALGLIDDRASSDLETDLKKRLDLYRQRSPFRDPGFERVTDRPVSEQ